MAPYEYQDFVGGRTELGNPKLKRTQIDNYDARWEVFPRPGELIAVSAFYKEFHAPIEQIVQLAAEVRITYQNAASAKNYGAEVEARKSLGFIRPDLKKWSLNANFTLVRSRVDIGETIGVQTSSRRPLQGQSPYLVNAMLAYDDPDRGASVSLLYNVFGRRISEVGELGSPDVYEMPRHKMDFTYKQYLNPRFNVKLAAKNLLDPDTLYRQGPEVYHRYKSGRSFSIGLGYSL
jgi:outer membrane receptor protein involved in Fe transport